jgi:hypothetical protein
MFFPAILIFMSLTANHAKGGSARAASRQLPAARAALPLNDLPRWQFRPSTLDVRPSTFDDSAICNLPMKIVLDKICRRVDLLD